MHIGILDMDNYTSKPSSTYPSLENRGGFYSLELSSCPVNYEKWTFDMKIGKNDTQSAHITEYKNLAYKSSVSKNEEYYYNSEKNQQNNFFPTHDCEKSMKSNYPNNLGTDEYKVKSYFTLPVCTVCSNAPLFYALSDSACSSSVMCSVVPTCSPSLLCSSSSDRFSGEPTSFVYSSVDFPSTYSLCHYGQHLQESHIYGCAPSVSQYIDMPRDSDSSNNMENIGSQDIEKHSIFETFSNVDFQHSSISVSNNINPVTGNGQDNLIMHNFMCRNLCNSPCYRNMRNVERTNIYNKLLDNCNVLANSPFIDDSQISHGKCDSRTQFALISSQNFYPLPGVGGSHATFISLCSFLMTLQYAISTYFEVYNNRSALLAFFFIRSLLMLIFMGDMVIQLTRKGYFLSITNLFDMFLISSSIVEFVISLLLICNVLSTANETIRSALMILGLVQLVRLYKLVFAFEELFLLSRGISHSLRSLRWTVVFVIFVIYGCAIYTTTTFADPDDDDLTELWGDMIKSMFTLFTVLTLEGWNDICSRTAVKHPFSRIFFVAYICFATLTLMNVVTGIILDTYVDISKRLSAESNYLQLIEKKCKTESALLRGFNETTFMEIGYHGDDGSMKKKIAPGNICGYNSTGIGETKRSIVPERIEMNNGIISRILNFLLRFCKLTNNVKFGKKSELFDESQKKHLDKNSTWATDCSEDPAKHEKLSTSAYGFTVGKGDLNKVTFREGENIDYTLLASSNDLIEHSHQPKNKFLDLQKHNPIEIIFHPSVHSALKRAEIPIFQAFDVLNIYHSLGIYRLSIEELSEACNLVSEPIMGRQILVMQITVQKELAQVRNTLQWLHKLISLILLETRRSNELPSLSTSGPS